MPPAMEELRTQPEHQPANGPPRLPQAAAHEIVNRLLKHAAEFYLLPECRPSVQIDKFRKGCDLRFSQRLSRATAARAIPMPASCRREGLSRRNSAASRMVPAG